MDAFHDDPILEINGEDVTPLQWIDRNRVLCRIRHIESSSVCEFRYRAFKIKELGPHVPVVQQLIGKRPDASSIDYLEEMNLL
jgi:hypothetical protein